MADGDDDRFPEDLSPQLTATAICGTNRHRDSDGWWRAEYHPNTLEACRVIQRLAVPFAPSMSKRTESGCKLPSGHRPFWCRLFATSSTASAARSSGSDLAARR